MITRPTQAVADEKIVTAVWVGTSASVWQVVYWSDSEAQYGFQGVHMSKRLPNYPLLVLSICSPPLWPHLGCPAHYWGVPDDLQMIKAAANLSVPAKPMIRPNDLTICVISPNIVKTAWAVYNRQFSPLNELPGSSLEILIIVDPFSDTRNLDTFCVVHIEHRFLGWKESLCLCVLPPVLLLGDTGSLLWLAGWSVSLLVSVLLEGLCDFLFLMRILPISSCGLGSGTPDSN